MYKRVERRESKKKKMDVRVQVGDGHASIKETSFPLTNANPSPIDGGAGGGFIRNQIAMARPLNRIKPSNRFERIGNR